MLVAALLAGISADAAVTGSSQVSTITLAVTCQHGTFASADALLGRAPLRLGLYSKDEGRSGNLWAQTKTGDPTKIVTVPGLNQKCAKTNFYYLYQLQTATLLISERAWVPGCSWNINGNASGEYYSGWTPTYDAIELIFNGSSESAGELGRAEFLPPSPSRGAYRSNRECVSQTSRAIQVGEIAK